jgi:hypothetical protein
MGGEFDQSVLYAYMEISQWNPFVQLIYVNKKKNRKHGQKRIKLKKHSPTKDNKFINKWPILNC